MKTPVRSERASGLTDFSAGGVTSDPSGRGLSQITHNG